MVLDFLLEGLGVALETAKDFRQNSYSWSLFREKSLQLPTAEIATHVLIVSKHSDFYFSIISEKFQLLSGLELQIFNTMQSC